MIFQNNRDFFKKKKMVFFKGSDVNTVDAAYNARMATIAETQQGMAEDYYDFYQNGTDGSEFGYQDMEQAQVDANMEMIPLETALQKEQIAAQSSLLPGQTALGLAENESALSLLPGATSLSKLQMSDATNAINEKAPVRNAFYQESLNGVDVDSEANRAGADAAQAFAGSQSMLNRDMASMGVNPNSSKFASMANTNSLNRAKTIAGARTNARSGAESDNYTRLTNAMGY